MECSSGRRRRHRLRCAMSKSDTWPGHIAVEPLSNMDSAESCDSVISVNSGYSEDSMEHLSPEERACLMYLQETIEALEVQDDSGLSNEEPDLGVFAEKMEQTRVNDCSTSTSNESEGDQNSLLSHEFPTSLSLPDAEPAPVDGSETENGFLTHTSEPESESVPAPDATELKAADVTPPDVDSSLPKGPAPLLPPPSDFMDVPDSPLKPEKVKFHPPSGGVSKPGATIDVEQLRQRAVTPTVNLEQLRQRAALRKTSLTPILTEEFPSKPPPDFTSSLSLSSVNSSPPVSPRSEPRTPPAVAPKPKRLPANILLKSLKTPAPPSEGNATLPSPGNSDKMPFDHQKVRMEALRKLGLLKSHEEDSSARVSPKQSPQSRRSWAAPSTPASPTPSNTPPSTPSHNHVNSSTFTSTQPHVSPAALLLSGASAAPRVANPGILPAPAAFSDSTNPAPSDSESPPTATPDPRVNRVTPSALIKQLPPPRPKAATLDRSLRPQSYALRRTAPESNQETRNSRPRPSSMGYAEEFLTPRGDDLRSDRSSSPEDVWSTAHSNAEQKLPRPQGVSVLISPRTDNDEDRREALKKLGLLSD